MNEKFDELYKKLNPAQKKAVDAIEGPVMVIAGPGTGKTQILTLRIANILKKTDTTPKNILALTFTESGSFSMRKRLVSIIGSAAYKVNIHTFHSFCNEIIERYPEEFPRIIGSSNVTESDQIKMMERIVEKEDYKKIKSYGDPFYHVRGILDAIRNLKREDIDPEALEKLVSRQKADFKKIPDLYHEKGSFKGEMKGKYKDMENHIEKLTELCDAYATYEKALREKKWIDFEDMIMEVIRELTKNKDLLLRLQEEYQYILADEHQDANNSQNRLLELLGSYHKSPNLFVVGDEKQAIFRFQGASLQNFLYFKKLYPDALIVNLEENYRSAQFILDSAHTLISHNQASEDIKRIPLKSNSSSKESKISLYTFTRPEYEYAFLAKDIEKKIKDGVDPSAIAILYRDNRDVFPVVRVFEKTTIPYAVESSQDVLGDNDIQKLLHIFKAIYHFGDEMALISMLHVDFLAIDPLDMYQMLRFGREKHVPIFSILKSKERLEEASVEHIDEIFHLYQKLLEWNKKSHNVSLIDFFETIVRESGFLDYILKSPGALDKMGKLENVLDEVRKIVEIKRDARLKDFMEHLDIIGSYNVLLKVKESGTAPKSVHLMTAHKAKGQEFDYVYIIDAYDKHWGNRRGRTSFHLPIPGVDLSAENSIDDERRLFYVALTRARKHVVLSYSETGENKEPQLPSQFLEEIDKDMVENVDTKELEQGLERNPFSYELKQKEDLTLRNQDYLRELFISQGLSVTALNNYLECPWKYFFRNLIRIPEVKEKTALYGTAVHLTLAHFFNKYKVEEDLTKRELLSLFKKHLHGMPLNESDLKEAEEKGERALSGYFDAYKGTWVRDLLTEYKVGGVFVDTKIDGHSISILLKGNLDKIEFLGGKDVRVVDYKTSKAKSRNEIEGKTKDSLGNLKRQLVFYKLLLEKHSDLNWCMKEGMLDFIEPDPKGKYKREVFTIENSELEELEEEIQRVGKEIYTFEFWNQACDDKKCEYCRMRQLMK